jgi:hypothetical protein
MLLFGGNNFDAVNELFLFDVKRREWHKLKPRGNAPSRRYGHQAIATGDGRMVIFGGFNGSFLNDVHELTLGKGRTSSSWRHIVTSGTAPIPRDGHSSVLSPSGAYMLVFGGFDGKRQLDDLFALDLHTWAWTELLPLSPSTCMGEADGADLDEEKGDEPKEGTGNGGSGKADARDSPETSETNMASTTVPTQCSEKWRSDACVRRISSWR